MGCGTKIAAMLWIVLIACVLWGPSTGSKTVNLAKTSEASDNRMIWVWLAIAVAIPTFIIFCIFIKTVMEGLLNIVAVYIGRVFDKIETWNSSLKVKFESIRDKIDSK